MEDANRTQKDKVPHRSVAESPHLLPLVILTLGIIGIAMFIGTIRINDRQLINFQTANALQDILILTTRSHLWLEESLGGDPEVDIEEVWADLNLATELGEALLNGGTSEHGLSIPPLMKPHLRLQMEANNASLYAYKEGVLKKSRQDSQGFLGLDQDEEFDAINRRIQLETSKLGRMVEKNQLDIQLRSRQLFTGILFSWIMVLCVAAWGLWKHASRRLAMEESLKSTNSQLSAKTEELTMQRERLLELIDERTLTLTIRNQQLRQEIAEFKKDA
jgi:hypothetical protein